MDIHKPLHNTVSEWQANINFKSDISVFAPTCSPSDEYEDKAWQDAPHPYPYDSCQFWKLAGQT